MTEPKNPRDLLALENVQKHAEQARVWALRIAGQDFDSECRFAIDRADIPLESPLEAIFLVWFRATCRCNGEDFALDPQQSCAIGDKTYRIDFTITPYDTDLLWEASLFGLKFPNIGVELDGHDYHERTKAQVVSRNRRDRDLQRAGWTVFHFSGSELHNDPLRCALEVFDAGRSALNVMRNHTLSLKRKHWYSLAIPGR